MSLTASISVADQSYDMTDGSKASQLTKDGELMTFLYDDGKTLYEAFQRGKKLSNDGPCLGTRVSPTGPYQWMTYSQVEERSVSFGAGLCKLGIKPGQTSFIGIYGPNCVEWVVCEQSCNAYSRVAISLYDTLGEEAIQFILTQAEISCVVCNGSKVQNLVKLKESCPQLDSIIVFEDTINDEVRISAEQVNIKMFTMKQVEEEGRNNPVDIMPAQCNDLATICYTSGTTGLPKGVMLTNENIISNTSAMLAHVAEGGTPITADDVHISYLPLAHMLERVAEILFFISGARIGFFTGDVKNLVNDIQELKPTIFISVPRLLNRLYDKTTSSVEGSKIKKWLYSTGYKSKLTEVRGGRIRNDSIWDTIVFKKVQATLGGRIRVIFSSSAPISDNVMDFLRVAFGCVVYEAYGQTESTSGVTFTLANDTTTGHVGGVLPCVRIKLRDVPGMNYYSRNGEGEVCFKGPSVTQGYYKNPEKTGELFDDGWARSGDIGKWLPNGTLKIIDRVKNIFKLSQGEYIAPEKVENICTRSSFIAQMFLFGDSLKNCCVAIIVPDEEVLLKWANENGRPDATFSQLCEDEKISDMIFDDMKQMAKAAGLNSLEIPKAIQLFPELFSVENELLTPTFKLKRAEAKTRFANDIEELYSKLS